MFSKQGSAFLFRFRGIGVYLHWTWALALLWRVWTARDAEGLISGETHGTAYHLLWVLAIFAIVLLHEFGHSLACKSVGGKADTIVLWPLGGVAFVQPPERPGAWLWSIVAGPLVNVVLVPITLLALLLARTFAAPAAVVDFAADIALVNGILLVFNLLPFYPLDGGQILRSLLWFFTSRGMSLAIAAGIGLFGAVGVGILGLFVGGFWIILLAVFMGLQGLQALRIGIAMYHFDRAPKQFNWQT